MSTLSFKQAVLRKGVSSIMAKASDNEKQKNVKRKSPTPMNVEGSGESIVSASVLRAPASHIESSQQVLLQLKYITTGLKSDGNKSGGSSSADEMSSDTDCTPLDGPSIYVEAKLLDVSATSSACATDSDSETGGSGGMRSHHRKGSRGLTSPSSSSLSSNSSCANDTEDSDSVTRVSSPDVLVQAQAQGEAGAQGGGKKKVLRVRIPNADAVGPEFSPDYVKTGLTPTCFTPGSTGVQSGAYTPDSATLYTVESGDFNFVYPTTPRQKVSIELDCPEKFVGRLIGKSGSTVRSLEQKTGVSIQIDQSLPKGLPRKVRISGHPQLVDEAEKIVEEVIKHGPPELNKRNVYKMKLNAQLCSAAIDCHQAHVCEDKGAKRSLSKVFREVQEQPNHISSPQRFRQGMWPADGGLATGGPAAYSPQHYYPSPTGPLAEPALVMQPPPAYPAAMHEYPNYHSVGMTYVPGYHHQGAVYPPKPPKFKVYATAAVAVGRFWSQHQSPTGQKYFVNHYTGQITNFE